jgi:predicted RecA/RadA family phage recombinase
MALNTFMATYLMDDESIDYTPSSTAVTAGDVLVVGDFVAVAKLDIAVGRLGALAVRGTFYFPKTAGTSTALAQGTTVYWDATNHVVTTTSSGNKLIGKVAQAAVDADTQVAVRMHQ